MMKGCRVHALAVERLEWKVLIFERRVAGSAALIFGLSSAPDRVQIGKNS